MDKEKAQLCAELLRLDDKCFFSEDADYESKCRDESVRARLAGNKLYAQKNHTIEQHKQILNAYTRSVAFGPEQTDELALAYANRSAFLLHLRKPGHGLLDVERALDIARTDYLKLKLFCRKVECLTELGIQPEVAKATFLEAVQCFKAIDEDHVSRWYLSELLAKTERLLLRFEDQQHQQQPLTTKIDSNHKEKGNVLDSVQVKWSSKYGKHLIATRSFRPGDVVYVEKPYVVWPNDETFPYLYCYHCTSLAFSAIACKFCSWCIFCSKKCRTEACQKYHSLECNIMPYVQGEGKILNCLKLAVRACLIGIKEAGGLDKLEAEFEIVNADKQKKELQSDSDKCKGSLSKDSPIDIFRNLYQLSNTVSEKIIKKAILYISRTLISESFLKYFFEDTIAEDCEIIDLIENDTVMFVGALLLKLIKVNRYCIQNFLNEREHNVLLKQIYKKNTSNGIFLPIISNLINNSCSSNTSEVFTEDSKIIIYATEPISKNSQIFLNYLCNHHDTPYNLDREAYLKTLYGFQCYCIACERKWPSFYTANGPNPFNSVNFLESQLLQESKTIAKLFLKDTVEDYKLVLNQLTDLIEKAHKILNQPSDTLNNFKIILLQAFNKIYGPNKSQFALCKN